MPETKQKTKYDLQLLSNEVRESIIAMLVAAGSGHSAGPLGIADVLTTLYSTVLKHDPKNPDWKSRDRFVLSAGHLAPVLYAILAHMGYFPQSELATLRKFKTRLQGHPNRLDLPGIENSSGPLGQGISQAIGMALAFRMDHSRSRVYCLMGDGEHNEGQVWEALLLAGKEKLHNLTALVDRNNIQIDGYTENVMPLDSLRLKYEAFGWHVLEIDGHNHTMIRDALYEAQAVYEKPTVIIAHTIAGKGVSFMEERFEWHGIPPGAGTVSGAPEPSLQANEALKELRTLRGRIRSEHE